MIGVVVCGVVFADACVVVADGFASIRGGVVIFVGVVFVYVLC